MKRAQPFSEHALTCVCCLRGETSTLDYLLLYTSPAVQGLICLAFWPARLYDAAKMFGRFKRLMLASVLLSFLLGPLQSVARWLLISLCLSLNLPSPVATEQFDQGRVPSQPFLLALCGDCNPGHHVHELRSQHGPHHQDPGTPAVKVHSTHSHRIVSVLSLCGL